MMIMVDRIKVGFLVYVFGILLLSTAKTHAQIGDRGVLLTEVSAGLNVYSLETNQNFTESTGASSYMRGNILYNFHKNVGFGLEFESHAYVDDFPDSVTVDKLSATRLGVGTQFHAINNQHFALSFGMSAGFFRFNYDVNTPNTSSDIVATGIYQNIHIITRFYFGKNARIGLFAKGGIINNPMRYKSYEYNGVAYEKLDGVPVRDYRVTSVGFHASVGVTYNWRVKKYY
jgi:hypothetical protein